MMQAFSSQRYDRLSDQYDRSHARWLRHEGGEAQCAFEGAAAALMRPDLSMLDVACGTGATIRRLIASAGAPSDLMLLDASQRMLDRCADLPGGRVKGLMQRLPFRADRFDLVTCAWGIETLDHPDPALAELVRVTRPGGHICLVFCAERPVRTIWGYGLTRRIAAAGLGRFLDAGMIQRGLARLGAADIRVLHCTGPAAALLARV